jgi:hypothetical protein
MEYKRLSLSQVQVKFGDDMHRTFEGYASVFNGVDSYGDSITPGAYESTLKSRDRPIRMRWNHFGPVIGKWEEMYEDEKGLYVRGTLTPGHSIAEDVYASLKHGAVDGMSIGYRVRKERTEGAIRKLDEIELIEISVVEEPADLGAIVSGVKQMGDVIDRCESLKELESILREAGGFSRANATALVSRIKSLSLGDREQTMVSLADRIKQMRI